MKVTLKIIVGASICALFLVGCGGSSAKYPSFDTQKGGGSSAQSDNNNSDNNKFNNDKDIAKNYRGVWVRNSQDGNKTGCVNDIDNGVSHFREITLDNQFKTVDISYSELNCEDNDIDTNVTKIYTYTLEAKNSSSTKDGTKMYAIDLTLQKVNQDDSNRGEKDYLIIGKENKKLIFIGRQYNNTKKDRDNYIKYNLKDVSNNSDAIVDFIK